MARKFKISKTGFPYSRNKYSLKSNNDQSVEACNYKMASRMDNIEIWEPFCGFRIVATSDYTKSLDWKKWASTFGLGHRRSICYLVFLKKYFNYVFYRKLTKTSSRFRGFFIFPHILKRWFMFLDRRFVGSSWRTIVSKTAVDQLIIPLPILSSFYVFLSALEGKTDIFEECNV